MLKNLWKQMRWSLRTQVIALLLVGLLFLIWHRREAWVFIELSTLKEPLRISMVSPDKLRSSTHGSLDCSFEVWDEKTNFLLVQVSSGPAPVRVPSFQDDDTIVGFAEKPRGGTAALNTTTVATFRRRFPEWWWGHFYRPEVWLLPLMLGLLVWSIRKDRAVTA